MKQCILLLCFFIVAPLHAAYTTATVASIETLADGRLHLVVAFTGNKGEGSKQEFFINSEADLKSQVGATMNALNGRTGVLPKYGPGTVIDLTPPVEVVSAPDPQIALDVQTADTFVTARNHLRALRALEALGVDVSADVPDAIKAVQVLYTPERADAP